MTGLKTAEAITTPATFTHLSSAVAALWESLRVLPLDRWQFDAFQYFLTRPDAVERAAEFIRRRGELVLGVGLAGRSHEVRIRPGQVALGVRAG